MRAPDRQALRKNAVEFANSPAFSTYVRALLANAGPSERPRGWFARTFNRTAGVNAFDFDATLRRLQKLASSAPIAEASVLFDTGIMSGGFGYCGPGLVVLSELGTVEGDKAAEDVADLVSDNVLDVQTSEITPHFRQLAAIAEDMIYRPFRRRYLPPQYGAPKHVFLADVMIQNSLLPNLSSPLCFVVEPGPAGVVFQVPGVRARTA